MNFSSDELINSWIEDFKESGNSLKEEIHQTRINIENEEIWSMSSDYKMHQTNIRNLQKYLKYLEDKEKVS